MKYIALALFAVAAVFVPACTTVEADHSSPTTTSTTTEETRSVHTPVGAASSTTTTRSY